MEVSSHDEDILFSCLEFDWLTGSAAVLDSVTADKYLTTGDYLDKVKETFEVSGLD